MKLGYPELAAGDGYKAMIGADQTILALRMQGSGKFFAIYGPPEAAAQLQELMETTCVVYNNLTAALKLLDDCRSLLSVCEEGVKRYGPIQPLFKQMLVSARANYEAKEQIYAAGQWGHTPAETEVGLNYGYVMHQAYPFMAAKYRTRSEQLIESTRLLFGAKSSSCMLNYSSVVDQSSSSGKNESPNVLGIFATRDIHSGERLLHDTTAIAASSFSLSYPESFNSVAGTKTMTCENCYGNIPTGSKHLTSPDCCDVTYCNAFCQDLALNSYHKVLCGKDFNWLYREGSRSKIEPFILNGPIWLRILACCVQSDMHPLDYPSIARLIPLYDQSRRVWSLSNNVATPIRILRQLGVDAFYDPRYDTWVLQTIWARIINNQQEHRTPDGRLVRSIGPLYSFFNHSCEPNAGWRTIGGSGCNGGSSKLFGAVRDIKEGEEICISYARFKRGETKAERYRKIAGWIGTARSCGCVKCRAED